MGGLGLWGGAMIFDREEPQFRRGAAIRGETADPAAGRDHPMARHDDRERVSGECLPNGARRACGAGPCRECAVGLRRAPGYATRGLVDAAVEWRHEVHVEQNGCKIARLPAQIRDDTIPRALGLGWRGRLPRAWKSPEHARAGFWFVSLWKLDASDPPRAPCDRASADRRIEECEKHHHDGPIVPLAAKFTCEKSSDSLLLFEFAFD
jgi:hypothetical protein